MDTVKQNPQMPDGNQCPQCGTPLQPSALAGLCPACLLKQGATEDSVTEGAAKAFVPPPVAELAPHFPQLEILELVGKGGMGAVYRARQRQLDRVVALKILPPGIGEDLAFAERFAREARALAKLNHPGIVTLYEFGVTAAPVMAGTLPAVSPGFQPDASGASTLDGGKPSRVSVEVDPTRSGKMPSDTSGRMPDATPPAAASLYFFLMEFVDGVNLRQLLHTGRVSPREALAIVPQICDALQFAHDQGIVHRDIKPENILLDRRGRVKVADFGLAKIVGPDALTPALSQLMGEGGAPAPGEGHPPRAALSDAGKVMGTPSYMAPEQREHPGEVDHRADIYALGVVFYQMLTGELPGKPIVPPSHACGKIQVDVRLDEVVLRALEKEPERRYQQASVLKTEVETIVTSPPPSQADVPSPPAAGDIEEIRRQVRAPAIGLIVSSVLYGLFLTAGFLVWTYGAVLSVTGKTAAVPWIFVIPIILVQMAFNFVALAGALRMKALRSHQLALAGSVSAMLGFTLPFGIWAFVVLNRPEVRKAFELAKKRPGLLATIPPKTAAGSETSPAPSIADPSRRAPTAASHWPRIVRRALVAGFAVWCLVVVAATVVTFLLPESYAAQSRVILRRMVPAEFATQSLQLPAIGSEEMDSQVALIRSGLTLGTVVTNLNLNQEWGRKYGGGEALQTSTSMDLLKRRMVVSAVRDLIAIQYFDENPAEAAKLANGIAEGFITWHAGKLSHFQNKPGRKPSQGWVVADEPKLYRVEIVDRAVAPARPSRPNRPLNIFLGFVGGAVLGIFAGVVTGLIVWGRQRLAAPTPPVAKPDRFWSWFALGVATVVLAPILISVGSILLAILLPALSRAKHQAQPPTASVVRLTSVSPAQSPSVLQFRRIALENETNAPVDLLPAANGHSGQRTFRVLKPVELDGSAVSKARLMKDHLGHWQIELKLTPEGKDRFAALTRMNIGRQLAMVFEDRVVSAPFIRSEISSGTGMIAGSFSEAEAIDMVWRLNQSIPGNEPPAGEHEFVLEFDQTRPLPAQPALLDLDRGRVLRWPVEFVDWNERRMGRWIEESGADLVAAAALPAPRLGIFAMSLAPADDSTWTNPATRAALLEKIVQASTDWCGAPTNTIAEMHEYLRLMNLDCPLPATYAFRTAEGTVGLLQIISFTENPRAVRLRYKLVQDRDAPPNQSSDSPATVTLPAGSIWLRGVGLPQVLDLYTKLTGCELDVEPHVQDLTTSIGYTNTTVLTRAEVIAQLEGAMREQAGVLVKHQGSNLVAVRYGGLELRWVADNGDPNALAEWLPDASDVAGEQKLRLSQEVLLDESAVGSAEFVANQPEQKTVFVRLTEAGSRRLAELTTANIGRQFAIVWRGRVLIAPKIITPITGGSINITGRMSDAEAKRLVDALNHRAAPSPMLRQPATMPPKAVPKPPNQINASGYDSGDSKRNSGGDLLMPETTIRAEGGKVIADHGSGRLAADKVTLGPSNTLTATGSPRTDELLRIQFDKVPLADAIKNLATPLKLNYVIDEAVLTEQAHAPLVTANWENLTVRQALAALLESRNLELVPQPQTGISLIRKKAAAVGSTPSSEPDKLTP